MAEAAIALGSNLDAVQHVRQAISLLNEHFHLLAASSLYSTTPMYLEDQPDFVNAAALIETGLGPIALLRRLKQIEGEMGRRQRERNGPREIDLDIIAYGSLKLDSDGYEIQIPHPRVAERRFVLEPLAEIAPDLSLPRIGIVESLLAAHEVQSQSLRRLSDADLPIHRP